MPFMKSVFNLILSRYSFFLLEMVYEIAEKVIFLFISHSEWLKQKEKCFGMYRCTKNKGVQDSEAV